MSNKHDLPPECGPLIERLRDEADLCRNEGASDVAALLDEGASALIHLRAWCLLRIHDLEAENEALKKDAQRLDAIERNARCDPKMCGNHVWWPTTWKHQLTGPTLRAAIDAAMTKEQKT